MRTLATSRWATAAAASLLAGASLAACAALTGCAQRSTPPDPVQSESLARRAFDLLLRAAESDLDVVRSNAIEALVDVAPRSAGESFRRALTAESALVRFAGCVAIGVAAERGAAPQVAALRGDPDERVRLGADFAAMRLGDQTAAGRIVAVLDRSTDELLRADAAFLLGKSQQRSAIPWLQRALKDEKSFRVRMHVYGAMAQLGDRSAVQALISLSGVDYESRVVALQSLAELGDPAARDALLSRLRSSTEFLETRLIAARGLGKIGARDGYDLALRNAEARFNEPEDPGKTFRIRTLAALALGAIGDAAALPALERVASTESDERVQVAACYAIVQITGKRELSTPAGVQRP